MIQYLLKIQYNSYIFNAFPLFEGGRCDIFFRGVFISVLLTLSEQFTANRVIGRVNSECCAFKSHMCPLFLSVLSVYETQVI